MSEGWQFPRVGDKTSSFVDILTERNRLPAKRSMTGRRHESQYNAAVAE